MPHETAKKTVLRIAMAATAVSAVLSFAKGAAWLTGGSVAMLATLADSLIDLGMSATNYMALRYAFQPADDDHRFGHGKAEGIAALAQSAFIAGSCAFVLLQSARGLFTPEIPAHIGSSVAVLAAGIVITLVLTHFQHRAARATGSLATEADAAHYTGDIVVNGGVIISLLAGKYLGWMWLDPVAALAVALWLLYTARGIGAKAIDMLLDRELDESVRADLMAIIRNTPGVEGLHDFRTRKSGVKLITSFDIEVDPKLTLEAAHEISRVVEAGILAKYFGAEVMIHIDPVGDITDSRHAKLKEFHAR
jgi:ferrous-iron efflux pump FieF